MKPIIVAVHGITPLLCNNYQAMLEPAEVGGKRARASRRPRPKPSLVPIAILPAISCSRRWPSASAPSSGGKGRKVGRMSLTSILMGTLFPGDEWTDARGPADGCPA